MQFGAEVDVVGPGELREMVLNEIKNMDHIYRLHDGTNETKTLD
jgi:predicted DNA-binding transcriptional regulator YafY